MKLGTYEVKPYSIQVNNKTLSGYTINYYDSQGNEFLVEEYYGDARDGFSQKPKGE